MRCRQLSFFCEKRAFTLVEMLVAATIASMALMAVVTGCIACQKVFSATDYGLKSSADQLRILDYIERDVRQALTVNLTNSGQMLTVTVPDYINTSTGQPRLPTIKPGRKSNGMPNGTVDYGDPATPVTVSYFLANGPAPFSFQTNGRYLIRQQGTVQTVISRDCSNLQVSFTDHTESVLTAISFAPRFTFQSSANSRSSTTVCAAPLLRNNRRN